MKYSQCISFHTHTNGMDTHSRRLFYASVDVLSCCSSLTSVEVWDTFPFRPFWKPAAISLKVFPLVSGTRRYVKIVKPRSSTAKTMNT